MRYPRNYSLNSTSSYALKFYILLPCVMFSFTTMLKHNSHHRPCPPTTPFPMFTSNRPYPVLFSHSQPAPSCLHACLKLSYYQGLLNLTVDDLYKLHVEKLGHQEIILESLELLRNFHYNLDQVQPGRFFYRNTNASIFRKTFNISLSDSPARREAFSTRCAWSQLRLARNRWRISLIAIAR